MSSDGSNDCRELSQSLYRASLEEKPCIGSSSDESEASSNSPGELVFEYLEGAMPFGREPLTDKVSLLCNKSGSTSHMVFNFIASETVLSCLILMFNLNIADLKPVITIPSTQNIQKL